MGLKFVKVVFPNGSTGTLYTNSSTSYVLIIQVSLNFASGAGVLYVQDNYGNAVGDLVKVYSFSSSGSITGSDSFSSTSSTTTGIASTTLSHNDSVSLGEYVFQVVRKGLLAQGFSLVAYQVTVYGFIAIEADSLEELRGFL
jgi:hypothetical protein